MGFGFNLFFALILVPSTIILLLMWLFSKKLIFGKTLGIIWLSIFGFALLSFIIQMLAPKKELKKKDYYGQYTIDRAFFAGKQADWQYNNFRFEIKENDSIYFYVTENERILQTFRGVITTSKPYNSERLIINMQQPTHHIMASNPTIYRSAWNFYLVFESPKFSNVYFKKGQWTSIVK